MRNIVQDFTKHLELSGQGLIQEGTHTKPSTIPSQAKSPKSRSFPAHVWAFEEHPHIRIYLGRRNLFSRHQPPPPGLEISGTSRQGSPTRAAEIIESPLAPVLKAEKHPALLTHKKEDVAGMKHVSIEGTAAAASVVNEDVSLPKERRPRPVFPTQNWTKHQLSHGGIKMAGSSF